MSQASATPAHLGRWTKTRSKIALRIKADPHADVSDLRQRLRAKRLADHCERWLAGTPRLTDAQRVAIARIITEGTTPTPGTKRRVSAMRPPDIEQRPAGNRALDVSAVRGINASRLQPVVPSHDPWTRDWTAGWEWYCESHSEVSA